jgi:hypothetical protein
LTPSLHALSQASGILSQLQICRQSLRIALQSQSQERYVTGWPLATAIAQQMDDFQPSKLPSLLSLEIVEKKIAAKTRVPNPIGCCLPRFQKLLGFRTTVTATIAVAPVSTQTRRKSELCLPNLNPSSIAGP